MIALMLVDKTVTFRSAHDKARHANPSNPPGTGQNRTFARQRAGRDMPQREAIVELISADGTQRSEHGPRRPAHRGKSDDREEAACKMH